ncbi:Transglycosylase SLT domain-containing protein [Clostridium collagenovorans DSM 3089]|uniref:Transglycosylase SLT domain-containing protein n=1 Tax=Clostridium collagenovorans DSM 3089 TaxID=1121306 RepID=A0A1M5WP37_9CLOT|nr:lytic transglycosylase domain-containing protein [Clostridium collagenovorans]SHH89229.1 Transglycosylase SLT domain-containing protein [Clostridium collagenovorans DSM 3089]
MIDNLKGLNNIAGLSSINSLGGCKCNSNSSATSDVFNMVLENLLKAMREQKQREANKSENIELFNNVLGNFNNIISVNNESLNKDEKIAVAIDKASAKYGVDANLIRAIIKAESNFNPNAVSSAGAMGLMQIMPANFKSLGITDPLSIEQNIEGGVRHIKQYLDRYNGNVEMALMAYNGGPGRMVSRGVTSVNDIYKMPKETQNYVPKVMKYYRGI